MNQSNQLLMAFYGDDFTGSTDALESLNISGIKTVLFIDVPTVEQLRQFPAIRAIGIAGFTRALSPNAMEEVLKPAFKALKQLKPRHIHYKVCSTFDSSPTIGSIGKAIEVGIDVFQTKTVPLLVAAPKLGRYCLFGNLFARMGIGSEGQIYRLDRHPSMRKHPITPTDESDIRLHLAKQTTKTIGLFDILKVHQYQEQSFDVNFSDEEIILFDALVQKELTPIGEIIDNLNPKQGINFVVGSSGVGMALGSYWQKQKIIQHEPKWKTLNECGPILVISGSCSPITSKQISVAIANGFENIAIDTIALATEIQADFILGPEWVTKMAEVYITQAVNFIAIGKSVIVHTSFGDDDQKVRLTTEILNGKNFDGSITSKLYGTLLGIIAKEVAARVKLHRLVVAGGDTSSYAARAMGITAVEMIAPLTPGAPICKAYAKGSPIDQLQLIFKGGQVGSPTFLINATK